MRHGRGHSLACAVRTSNSTPFMNFRTTNLIEPDQAAHHTRYQKLGRSRHVTDFSRSRSGGLPAATLLFDAPPGKVDGYRIPFGKEEAVSGDPDDQSVETMAKPTSTAEAARRYLARGWSVLPLRERDKRPLILWEHLQNERPSESDIAEWFRRWPDANVGIVTGEISNLIVLDIDPKHGGDATLDRLERRFRPLSSTVEAVTGGGGRHLYFAHPGGLTRNRAGLAQGIDLRGDGGYIVAPPSIHPSGRPYRWVPGRGPDEITLAPLPRWLIVPIRGPRIGRSLFDWRRLVREGVTEGQRNSTIASLTGHLLWHGVDPDVALELLLAWNRMRCRPPLDDAEVAQVVASITRLHDAESAIGHEQLGLASGSSPNTAVRE